MHYMEISAPGERSFTMTRKSQPLGNYYIVASVCLLTVFRWIERTLLHSPAAASWISPNLECGLHPPFNSSCTWTWFELQDLSPWLGSAIWFRVPWKPNLTPAGGNGKTPKTSEVVGMGHFVLAVLYCFFCPAKQWVWLSCMLPGKEFCLFCRLLKSLLCSK